MNEVGQYAKAIAAGVMALATVLAIVFNAELPTWLTEEWVIGVLAILTPFVVLFTPNRRGRP